MPQDYEAGSNPQMVSRFSRFLEVHPADRELTGRRYPKHRLPHPGCVLGWTSTVREKCKGEGEGGGQR